MPRSAPKNRRKATLVETLRAALRAAVLRAGGLAMVALAIFIVLAVSTYAVSDPSLNTATQRGVQNLAGGAGAAFSDLALQVIGAPILLFAPPLAIWGAIAALRGAPDRTPWTAWLRLALAPVVVAGACLLAAGLPAPQDWPFVAGLGGIVGDSLLALGADWLAPGTSRLVWPFVGAIGALALVASYAHLCGLNRQRLHVAANATARACAAIHGRFLEQFADPPARAPRRRIPEAETDEPQEAPNEPVSEEQDESAEAEPAAAPKRRIIRKENARKAGGREAREAQGRLAVFDSGSYELPPLNLLSKPKETRKVISDDALEQNARMLETVLADFGVRGEIGHVRPGPVVTLYELEPAAGVKSSRVISLADDIARSMSAVACRVAVVPGRNAIGIELPNQDRETVFLRELLSAAEFENSPGDLTLSLGKSIGGEPIFADLARMPHLLIAGTTGSGKSVGINTMILSLLYRLPPDRCKLIMVDPKMLELSVYEGIPHLLSPVVTDPKKAVVALKWTVREMEERYRRMSKVGVRNIEGFNKRVREAGESGETLTRTVHTGYDQETGEPVYETEELDYQPMPFIVVVIDEVADLMMVAGKDIEGMVQRLAQMARAAGIHLIMATQRPSVDVITGTIKANFPTRISFQVTSKIDSRTILGEQGAEQLLGQGDMLYMAGGGRIRRVHGSFVSDAEVEQIVAFLKTQGAPDYVQEVTELKDDGEDSGDGFGFEGNGSSGDALYDKAVAVVLRDRKASTSYIQRRLQIGYNRAASLMERMEEEGLVSSANHAGKREILVGEDAA